MPWLKASVAFKDGWCDHLRRIHHNNMRYMPQVPESAEDIYSDEVIVNPWPVYQHLRDLGPVVYLSRLDNYALTQHAGVRQALRDNTLFVSGDGAAV